MADAFQGVDGEEGLVRLRFVGLFPAYSFDAVYLLWWAEGTTRVVPMMASRFDAARLATVGDAELFAATDGVVAVEDLVTSWVEAKVAGLEDNSALYDEWNEMIEPEYEFRFSQEKDGRFFAKTVVSTLPQYTASPSVPPHVAVVVGQRLSAAVTMDKALFEAVSQEFTMEFVRVIASEIAAGCQALPWGKQLLEGVPEGFAVADCVPQPLGVGSGSAVSVSVAAVGSPLYYFLELLRYLVSTEAVSLEPWAQEFFDQFEWEQQDSYMWRWLWFGQ